MEPLATENPERGEERAMSEFWLRLSTDPKFYERASKIANRAMAREIRRQIRMETRA